MTDKEHYAHTLPAELENAIEHHNRCTLYRDLQTLGIMCTEKEILSLSFTAYKRARLMADAAAYDLNHSHNPND